MSPTEYGERKHETCRFGSLTKAFRISPPIEGEPVKEVPALLPLCGWRAPEPHPPAVDRAWGGAIEYDRDCAVCVAHEPVPASPWSATPTIQEE